MLLYLAGLKGVDPSLREAAKIDGASEATTFFRVVFPVMRPINIIVLVVTFIESLRAFDLVWVINKGRNGLELISALVTQNVVGEASRIGFGSALATIMLAHLQRAHRHLPAHRHEGGLTMTAHARTRWTRASRRRSSRARAGPQSGRRWFLPRRPRRSSRSIWLFPLLLALVNSFRDYAYTAKHGYMSWGGFTLDNYRTPGARATSACTSRTR